jgi:hypothetical protein
MVNCLFESPFPSSFKEWDEILLCVVAGKAGLVAPGEERLEARLGCFNCPGSGCSSSLEKLTVPRVSWRGVNGGPGCLFEFICREVFKGGLALGSGVLRPDLRPPLRPMASAAKKTSATKLLLYY